MVKTEMMDLDLQLHQQLLLAITFTWLMWEILQLSYQCRDRQRRQANKTTTFQPSFLISHIHTRRIYRHYHTKREAEMEPVNDPVAVEAAAALAIGKRYCFHCRKMYAPRAMALHNKNKHGNLGGPNSAECRDCKTLYRTLAEKIIHSQALHGHD